MDIVWSEDRECTGGNGDELGAWLEKRDVPRGIVGLSLGNLPELRVPHSFRAVDDVLHIDVPAVGFPDARVRRAGVVLLDQRKQTIAVELVAADRDGRHVGRPQILERLPDARRQMCINGSIAQPIDDHPGAPGFAVPRS